MGYMGYLAAAWLPIGKCLNTFGFGGFMGYIVKLSSPNKKVFMYICIAAVDQRARENLPVQNSLVSSMEI
jgi:hypothetical protein